MRLALDDFALTGLLYGCGLFGSAVLAMAVVEGELTATDAFEVARIDEAWQAQQWGEDDEAKAVTALRRVEARALESPGSSASADLQRANPQLSPALRVDPATDCP